MHLKQVLCNYLNKQNYSDFFVLMTFFIIFRLNLLVFIVVLINLEFLSKNTWYLLFRLSIKYIHEKIYWHNYTLYKQKLEIKKSFSKNDFDGLFRGIIIKIY